MWEMAKNSITLFFQGKLFADAGAGLSADGDRHGRDRRSPRRLGGCWACRWWRRSWPGCSAAPCSPTCSRTSGTADGSAWTRPSPRLTSTASVMARWAVARGDRGLRRAGHAGTAMAYRRGHREPARRGLAPAGACAEGEPAAVAAMKAVLADDLVYAVFRRHGIVKPSLSERVEAALASVRPMLATHGGDVELVACSPPMAEVRFLGACDGCPASRSPSTLACEKAI